MARQSRRDEGKAARWREAIAAQGKCGLTVREFCRQRGISEHGFYCWRRELRLRESEAPAFAAVTLRADSFGLGPDEIELRLAGGERLRFRSGCPAASVAGIVAALSGARC